MTNFKLIDRARFETDVCARVNFIPEWSLSLLLSRAPILLRKTDGFVARSGEKHPRHGGVPGAGSSKRGGLFLQRGVRGWAAALINFVCLYMRIARP